MRVSLNWWAIIVAALAQFIIGWIWYGVCFEKQWLRLSGQKDMKPSALSMVGGLIGSLVMSFVLAYGVLFANAYFQSGGFSGGLMSGFFYRFGFIAPVTLGVVLHEKKSWALWLLNNGYRLISLLVMGVILSMWK